MTPTPTPMAKDHSKELATVLHEVTSSVGTLLPKDERLLMQEKIAIVLAHFWIDNPECCPHPDICSFLDSQCSTQ